MVVFWFVVIVSVVNLFCALIWSSKTIFNVIFKMYFILAFLFGGWVLATNTPEQITEGVQQGLKVVK